MGSDEQFSLCWNNFHSNMSTGFHGLLSRGDLVDVTLAAEGRLLQAHKLVLSVCSPYFQEMFKMNPTQHPIVFLKDVSHSALRDLLQFMYQGEVNVKQEELASFISTAEQLQVKGLTGNQNEENSTPASKPKPSSRPGPRSSQQRLSMTKPETDLDNKPNNPVAIKRPNRPSVTPTNPQSSQPAPAKRKCIDPLEAGPSGASSKEDFVTIPDDEDNAVAPKMEPEFVNEALWEDDDDGTNNDDGTFGEDDSNMDMTGFGDGSVTGDTTIAGATEGGAVGDAQDKEHTIPLPKDLNDLIKSIDNALKSKTIQKKERKKVRRSKVKSMKFISSNTRTPRRQVVINNTEENNLVEITSEDVAAVIDSVESVPETKIKAKPRKPIRKSLKKKSKKSLEIISEDMPLVTHLLEKSPVSSPKLKKLPEEIEEVQLNKTEAGMMDDGGSSEDEPLGSLPKSNIVNNLKEGIEVGSFVYVSLMVAGKSRVSRNYYAEVSEYDAENDSIVLNYMASSGKNFWVWPEQKEESCETISSILLRKVDPPELINNRGQFQFNI